MGKSDYQIIGRGRNVIAIAGVVFFIFACLSNAATAADKVIKLKFSSAYMPFEPPNIQANHVLDLVEKKTNGKVKVERFMGGALGGPLEQLELVSTGAVDIIGLHADQFPQQLPLHQILNTEQFTTREKALANVTALTMELPDTKALFEKEQERNNIKILSWHIQGVTGLTMGYEAKSLDDLKGKKISVITGFQRKVFKDFGWIPVNVQIPELYESLSRGVIDGIFMATAAVIPLKWYEVSKSHLILGNNQVLSQPITLNLDCWNRLPKDVQQAFIEASRETAQWTIEADRQTVAKTYEKFKESGVTLVKLTEEENNKFFTIFSKYAVENYLQNAKKRRVETEAKKIIEYWDQMKWGKWKK